ncbi:alpha/beta fold hydrolase [Actinomycetospora soli]|uniref:alpha/beta fold hydrolase n=1 Tax=Actinomycetospora soli TaxID=2893887 RepID=UPI001E502E39|nr:alpha/beta hydrolase [Actinomycetospora soli]MCD2186013.1 alpha/beta hydrolase [Actinomycetospora soli]
MRRFAVGLVVLALVAVVLLTTTGSAPVGHFTSAAGKDRFDAAYGAAMARMPPPDATLDVRTGFGVVRMYRYDGAPGDPLVLLPGRAAPSPLWADNLATLRAVRTVYLIDLLGEPGASVQSRPITDDADQAAWLAEALAAVGAPRVHLVGYSIGGWTAANLATPYRRAAGRSGERLASVVLLDPAMTYASLPLGTVLRSVPASVRRLPRSWRDAFASYTANGAPVEHEPVAEMIEAGMQTYPLALPQPGLLEPRLPVPTLVILAGRSVMHDSAVAAATANRLGARVLTYPDASHALTGDYPDRVAADVAAFLTS